MENNQEHKIDKIFRETFENQLFTPPTDAWMGIHTYTIGQEESKKKVWLRYASLALLLLLVFGFSFWYFVDDQDVKWYSPVAGLPTSPLVRKHTQKPVLPTNRIAVASISPRPIVHEHTPTLITQEVGWSGDQPQSEEVVSEDTDHGVTLLSQELLDYASQWKNTNNGDNIDNKLTKKEPLIIELVDDSLMKDEIEFVEPVCYFNQYKIAKIDFKPLIINDLSDKMQNESERKIVALEESFMDKKEGYKADSVVYGDKFSLKHPIITVGLGQKWSFWRLSSSISNETGDIINGNSGNIKIGIAWNLNKKSRLGFSFENNNYNINFSEKDLLYSQRLELGNIGLNKVYTAQTHFGEVHVPVSQLKDFPTQNLNTLDTTIYNTFIGVNNHGMRTSSLLINFQFDIFSLNKKKKYNYQFYGIADLVIQRQTSYLYTSQKSIYNDKKYDLMYTTDHLANASQYVFGLQTGLGFRKQFARRWDFYLESKGLISLNSWTTDKYIDNYQRAISIQAGINLNL
jgi:hypothetical protein